MFQEMRVNGRGEAKNRSKKMKLYEELQIKGGSAKERICDGQEVLCPRDQGSPWDLGKKD